MAVPNLPFNPNLTTNAVGSFSAQSIGYRQGDAMDDPAVRNALAGGTLASTETLPMWGGIAIGENIPAAGSYLGAGIIRAANNAGIMGFSVFNQNGSMLTTPQSTCPVSLGGGHVNFYRLGSRARIAVQIDPTLAASLQNGTTASNVAVTWDFTNQKIIAFDSSNTLAAKILDIQVGNSLIVAYDSVNNLCTWTPTGSVAIILI